MREGALADAEVDVRVRLGAHDHEKRVPGQRHRGRVVGAALEIRVEQAIKHAGGVLGPHQMAAEPVQVVRDAREHQPRACCCCCCWPNQPAWRMPGS